MSATKPLSPKELKPFQFLLDTVKSSMGFIPNSMKTMARVPAILGSFSSLAGILVGDPTKVSPMALLKLKWKNVGWSAKFAKDSSRVSLELRQMVAHISSKASGCRYCQAHTIKGAHNAGGSADKLADIWNFATSPHFDESEKAALHFGFAAGCVPNAVTSEHFVQLRKHFSEEQIVELGATVALFGFLNRWNDTFATELETEPIDKAMELLGGAGWEVGKHG